MRFKSPHRLISWTAAAVLALVLPGGLLAFRSSLQPEEIEDAYSLGRSGNREELANFLKSYEHDFSYPASNPDVYVQSVEFETPYEQIVLRSVQTNGYSKFQAAEDYRANPRLVVVRVVTALKINYGGPIPADDGYRVVVFQSNPIEPRNVSNRVACNPYSPTAYPGITDCTVYTREIRLSFDASQFDPGHATVNVHLPGGQTLATSYDLSKLK